MPAFIEKMQLSVYACLKLNECSQFQQAQTLLKAFENAMIYFKKFIAIYGAHYTFCH